MAVLGAPVYHPGTKSAAAAHRLYFRVPPGAAELSEHSIAHAAALTLLRHRASKKGKIRHCSRADEGNGSL